MPGEARRNWRTVIVGLAVGATAGAVGFAAADVATNDGQADPPGAQTAQEGAPVRYVDETTDSGRNLDIQAAIEQVRAGMHSDSIDSIVVVSGSQDSAPWVQVNMNGDLSAPGTDVLLTWRAALAQGAVADLARSSEPTTQDVIGGMKLVVQTPPGDQEPLDGGTGYVAAGQVFASQTNASSDSEITEAVTSAAEQFGLEDVHVAVMRPLGAAVEVTAVLPPSAKVDWSIDDLRDAISGKPRAFEGVYIEIQDAAGDPLLKSGVAYRTGTGGLWFAKGQDALFNANHGGLPAADGGE